MNYSKHYNTLVFRAKNRIINSYTEEHHIYPECMGGLDIAENLVNLTPEEHYVAHQLLIKIYPNEPKLIFALIKMTGNNGYRTNKIYGWMRKKLSETRKGFSYEELYGVEKAKIMKEKQSKRKLGKTQSAESNKKRSMSLLGRSKTEEHRKNMKIAQQNRPQAIIDQVIATRTKNGNNFRSQECKQKISQANANTIWINNGFISKKIKNNEIIPDGFAKGRHKNK